jgi:hypothetical protein
MSIAANGQYTQDLINQALEGYDRLGKETGVEEQAQLCPQLLANSITKDRVIESFVITKREDHMTIKAHQSTQGRRLTEGRLTNSLSLIPHRLCFARTTSKFLNN